MKTTKSKLRKIIKEEMDKAQEESHAREVIAPHLKAAFDELGLDMQSFRFYAKMMVNEFRG